MLRLGLMGRTAAALTTFAVASTLAVGLVATPAAGTAALVDVTDSATTAAPADTATTPAPADTATGSPAPADTAAGSATPTPTVSASPTPTPSPSDSASTAAPAPVPSAPAPAEPPAPAPVAPAPVLAALPTALGSWCTALFPEKKASVEKRKAWEVMGGTVDMGDGGTYRLAERPNWKPQSGTDTSGDRHVNSLDWALPLLYRGVKVQNRAMVERFQQLMHYWIADHQGKRGTWVDASIYGGLRTQTLVCAAQTLNDPTIAAAAMRDVRTMARPNFGARGVAVGANNTDLIRQLGALAGYCWTGDIAGRDRAWANTVAVARGVVQADGSDVEGSPGYAMYIENLLRDAERAAATCALPADPLPQLRSSLYDFVAQATQPDYQLPPLGDTITRTLNPNFGVGDARADWVRSGGAAGEPPAPVYSAFAGGYVFGRAGWRPQPGGPDTYYSLRYSSTRPATAHTHDDGGALTIYSRGVPWVTDRGPYRYENASSLRAFVKTRAAHSSITVGKVARSRWSGVQAVRTGSDWQLGGNDTTCLRDRTWKSVGIVRCVQYIRSVDAFVVADYVDAAKAEGRAAKGRFVWERWHLTPGLSATNANGVLTLASGDKRLDIVKSGPGGWSVDIANSGSSVGWHTGKWGERLPAAVLNRKAPIGKQASSQTLVTVFVPRTESEAVPVTVDANGVTITRGGLTITTPLPRA